MKNSVVEITRETIISDHLIDAVRDANAGAIVLFLGTVRELTNGQQTSSLEYEAFDNMAITEIQSIIDESKQKWPLQKVAVVHRIGHLEIGDVAVGVAASSPHRKECFEATQFIMDRIKQSVPIWKKENWADGSSEWVHPGVENTEPTT